MLATFSGKGLIVTPEILQYPIIRWEKLEMKLYDNKIDVELGTNKFSIELDKIVDIGEPLPDEVIEKSKFTIDLSVYGTITYHDETSSKMLAFIPETSIYGKKPIEAFLKKLFSILLDDKEILIKAADGKWEKGYIKIVDEKIKENFITKVINKIVVKTDSNEYDISSNIKSIEFEDVEVNNEIKTCLKIIKKEDTKKVILYLYVEDDKVKKFLLRYFNVILDYHVGILRYL
ncbi:CheF family chemotaxis protein [Methanocaldococcus indicus]|uniref:CheF family chemotaxis protein n=1 Tax=Methanocaldococcus indicus TaxID=213231 RepID=UPI003C6CCE79